MNARCAASWLGPLLAWALGHGAVLALELQVDAANPAASDANPGSDRQPLRTIAAASRLAGPGDTVVVHAGTYREVLQPLHSGEPGRPITYRAQGEVWLKGSDVVGDWQTDGSDWVHKPWRKRNWYDPSLDAASKAPYASSARQDQVFFAGMPLQWVPDPSHLVENSFCWAADGSELRLRLTAGQDPNAAQVEVPVRKMVIGAWPDLDLPRGMTEVERWRATGKDVPPTAVPIDHIVIRGFQCAHNAATVNRAGVRIQGHDWLLEDTTVEWMNAVGIGVDSDGAVLRRNHTEHNGQLGISGTASHVRLEDNTTCADNQRDFDVSASGGGCKITDAHDWTIRNQLSVAETGPGIWCDIECSGITILGATILGNRPTAAGGSMGGIFYEISYGPSLIQDALVIGNHAQRNVGAYGSGITVSSSRDVQLTDNVILFSDGGVGIKGGVRHPDHATGTLFASHGLDHYETAHVHASGTVILGTLTSALYIDDPRSTAIVDGTDVTFTGTTILACRAQPDLYWAGQWTGGDATPPAHAAPGLVDQADLAPALAADNTLRERLTARLRLLLQAINRQDHLSGLDPAHLQVLTLGQLSDHAQVLYLTCGDRTCAVVDCPTATTIGVTPSGAQVWSQPGQGWTAVAPPGPDGTPQSWPAAPGVHVVVGADGLTLR